MTIRTIHSMFLRAFVVAIVAIPMAASAQIMTPSIPVPGEEPTDSWAQLSFGHVVKTDIDDFVRDVVGEMANMIGGQGKRDLAPFELRLGLPQVIHGGAKGPHTGQHDFLRIGKLGRIAADDRLDAQLLERLLHAA